MWLDAPIEVRAERIGDRDETATELRERERSDAERFRSAYGIDVDDPSVYDLVVDANALSEAGMVRTVAVALDDVRSTG